MDGAILPLTFYCRNAQQCLAKANESQKSGFVAEELQHLKTFTTLVSETIPSHPNYRHRQEDKQVLELHAYLPEAAKRIRELESSTARLQPRPQTSKPQGRLSSRHPKPPLASSVASQRSPLPRASTREEPRPLEPSSNNVGDEEERSCNETSEDTTSRGGGFRASGYGDDSSADSTLKHSHHRRKPKPLESPQQRRGNGLREWKGDFVRKSERIHGERRHSNSISNNNFSRVEIRPTSAPRRMQGHTALISRLLQTLTRTSVDSKTVEVAGGTVERKAKEGEDDEVEPVVRERPAILASRLQRGMKEECEHFRRDMRILLEKAHDSRTREAEVEGILRGRLVDEMDLASASDSKHHQRASSVGTNIMKSPRMNRLRGGHPPTEVPATLNAQQAEQEENIKPTSSSRKTPSASRDTASGSSSGSSMTSLPLSHYIQKLKNFSPDSQLGCANLELIAPVNKGNGKEGCSSDHRQRPSPEETGALTSPSDLGHTNLNLLSTGGSAASAIFLPASTNSSNSPHGGLARPLFGVSAHSALYSSLAHPPPLLGVSRLRPSQQETTMVTESDRPFSLVTPLNDQLLYPHFQNDTENDTPSEAKDDKLNAMQRLLGELKGSVQGMKIRLEVDGQGWRDRVEGLEKELENLKEEADDEIIAAKHSLRNEMKVKLGDLMAEMERIRHQERDEVEVMVKERIEKQLKAQKETRSSVDMKDEIHRLWAEVDALVKNRQDMQGHVEHLASVAQKAQEHANREHEMLKSENGYLRKQLQNLKQEGVQVRLETENFRVERENLRQAVDELRGEGTGTKLEIQGLRKMEKLIKADLEVIRTGFVKFQEETQDLQRQTATLQGEGGRERKLIMEKVESLSQRCMDGLEEVRGDVYNVKFNCRDRIQEFQSQWNELRTQLPELSNFASANKQMLLNELDHFRSEIADMVEIERGLVQQTLEQESERVQHEVKDLLASSKGEIVNILKVDVQKWLQGTHEGVFHMTETLKQDFNHLKSELSGLQERAEDLMQLASTAELQRDVAAAAAADASMSATKASNVLMEVTTSISNEMSDTHRRINQFQENLITENDSVASALYEARKASQELRRENEATFVIVQEARKKHKELQDSLERESSRLSTALMIVHKERDAASLAASEATSSAMKARNVLSDIHSTYDLEMAKVRQLQESIENERALKHSYSAKDRFNEELELAIVAWKRAMNTEISQAKEEAEEMQKNLWQHSSPFDRDHPKLQVANMRFADQPDLKNYILKTEESISGLAAMVKELQEYYSEEKRSSIILKQQEHERKEQHWNGEISQINQVVRVVEKRVLDVCGDYTEMRKRLKKCEGAQLDLVQSVEDVSSNTSELAKTVSSWLPRYEAAARVVKDLSCKVKRVEEKVEGFNCDEGLVQRISRIAETKVEGLKELVSSSAAMEDIGQELRDLHERVESSDRVHCQAVGEVASRVTQLERTVACGGPGQPYPGLSLKVEYTDSAETRKQGMGSLSQSVEALERKMEYMTEHTGALVGDHESATDSRLLGLERRFEHVASATFTNLRLLDSKVDRVALGMQSAVEGAALAESKCGALGAELVKVFRMLTASNTSNSNRHHQAAISNHSPSTQPADDSCNQSPRQHNTHFMHRGSSNPRALFSPKRRSRIYISPRPKPAAAASKRHGGLRTMTRNGEADCMKNIISSAINSGSGKLTAREQGEAESTHSGASEEDGSSVANKQSSCYYSSKPVCKLHVQGSQQAAYDRSQAAGEENNHQAKSMRHNGGNRSNSAIRLEAGRLQVNVSHRSENKQRENLIAVQS